MIDPSRRSPTLPRPCLPQRASLPRFAQRAVAALVAASIFAGGPLQAAIGSEAVPGVTPPAPSAANLPALGDSAAEGLSPAGERALGDRIMRDIWRDPAIVEDAELQEHVGTTFARLVDAARRRGEITPDIEASFAWTPFLVRDRTVNAFALPGGYVGVHLGLIAMTPNLDELASVLAHELSHVTQRHIVRMMSVQQRQSLVGLAAMILGVIAASRSPQAAQALVTSGQAVAMQGQLNFSRDMEREADRVGFGVLSTAGYAESGMAQMFELLAQASNLNDDGSFPYLRSHPLTVERIGEARARARQAGDFRTQPAVDVVHTLMRARARVLMDPRALAWQRLITDAQAGALPASPLEGISPVAVPQPASAPPPAALPVERLAASYAGTLAALQMRDLKVSAELYERMLRQAEALPPDQRRSAQRELARLGVEMALVRDDGRAADAALAQIAGDSGRVAQFLRARRALLPGADLTLLRQCAAVLQTMVAQTPADAPAWALLSQLWDRMGQPLRSLRADAEAVALHGDLDGAIDRLRAGQRRARGDRTPDFVEISVIDARLRTLEQERRRSADEDQKR
ncbi:MAG: hypothetical protein EPO12_06565 [Aquabacterium sp.]|nr:MAG: hypothetical protein EPO12_06565 [Aquabacterium sp.]